jgi:hypothetical protein
MTHVETNEAVQGGPGSFCIPRIVIDALIAARASAYEICTYLVLARFTDWTGQFSSASISAVNRYTGANKTSGGPVDRAIKRLKTIHARRKQLVSNGRSGKAHQMIEQLVDLGPILFDRDSWEAKTQQSVPDRPSERSQILHVLPDFCEALEERVWFGGNLVTGLAEFNQPLKALKNAGDVAARLLLLLYAANDMETWGGVRPVTATSRDQGPWCHYEPVSDDVHLRGSARLIRAKGGGAVGPYTMFSQAWPAPGTTSYWEQHREAGQPCFAALNALQASGFVYEVVMVLNRNAKKSEFGGSGDSFSDIPVGDIEPLYELDCRSQHGYKPAGEEGIGGVIASTAGDLGHPVTTVGGHFDGTYGAIVLNGHGAMIAGIYRLRFRVANRKNAGVTNAWARIHQNNRDALELLDRVRQAHSLAPLGTNQAKKKTRNQGDEQAVA